MRRTFLMILYASVEAAVQSLADDQHKDVSQNFRTSDPYGDPGFSNTIAAKNGYRLYTNTPEYGLKETLTVTYSDGLYVAGEKVVTESEHRQTVHELRSEHRRVVGELRTALDETKSEVLALVQALREVSPANKSMILQPPTCEEPGGDKLHFNGTHWECVCKAGFSGETCDITHSPTYTPTYTPTTLAPSTAPTAAPNCSDGWSEYQGHCYKLFTAQASWGDARTVCVALGGDLVSIHSQEENEFIYHLGMTALPTWTGGNDIAQEGVWVWSDGSTWEYSNFAYCEPGNCVGNEFHEDCFGFTLGGAWADWSCSTEGHFVCKT